MRPAAVVLGRAATTCARPDGAVAVIAVASGTAAAAAAAGAPADSSSSAGDDSCMMKRSKNCVAQAESIVTELQNSVNMTRRWIALLLPAEMQHRSSKADHAGSGAMRLDCPVRLNAATLFY
jgi:hypothetical protein